MINWQNCLRTFPWVREQWAREHGLEGLDGPDFDRCLDQVMERIGVTDSCSELNGPHQRLKEGCEALGWDFKLITRNVDPAKHDPDLAGYVGFGDVTGSKLSTQKTYLADAHAARRRPGRQLPRRADPGRGRARGRGGGDLRRPGRRHGPGRGSRAAGRRRLRLDRVARAPAALGDRRARRRRLPAPSPRRAACSPPTTSRRTPGGERRSPRSATSSPRAPTATASCSRAPTTRSGSAAAATPWQSGRQHKQEMARLRNTSLLISLIRDRGHGRVDVDAAGNAVPSYRLADELDVANFRAGLEAVARVHEAAGAQRIVALSRRPLAWSRGEDFDAFLSAASRVLAGAARARRLLRPSDGELPDGQAIRRARSPTRGASSTTPPGSGSATRAPSRPPRAPTR